MRVVPFHPGHLHTLIIQPMQVEPPVQPDEAERLIAAGPSFSAVGEDGTVHAIAGLIHHWPGRSVAWAFVGFDAGPHLLTITREIRKFLATCGIRRVEASVRADFPAAIRWMAMLGFERETPEPMRGYDPSGFPCYLYARVIDP